MPGFAETCRQRGVTSLSVFGDSITFGMAATSDDRRWANRLAAAIGATTLRNKGIPGTVLQGSPMADGQASRTMAFRAIAPTCSGRRGATPSPSSMVTTMRAIPPRPRRSTSLHSPVTIGR